MFCPACRCEFSGWTGKCPDCGTLLVSEGHAVASTQGTALSYNELIDLVKKNGGKLIIDVSTTEVGIEKKWSFPYFGYGYAWSAGMYGSYNDIAVDLTASDIGKVKKMIIPWFGYGYAWVKTMHGSIGGNEVILHVKKVNTNKSWFFKFGFGFAWTQEMSGKCGDRLNVEIVTTEVGRKKEFGFPWRGYGYAWAKKGKMTLSLI